MASMDRPSPFRGVSRRDFMKYCSWVAGVCGFGAGGVADVALALEKLAKRPAVVYLSLQQCTGCAISLLQSRTPSVQNLILQQISLEYQDNVMAAAGKAAEAQFERATEGDFWLVIEGSVPTDPPEAVSIAGRSAGDILKEVYPKAKGTIAHGSCACYGNIQASKPNPTGAKGVARYLREDGRIEDPVVINMSRCPGNGDDLVPALSFVLVTGEIPELDAVGRPKFLYGQTIHDSCFRRGFFEAGEFVESFDDLDAIERFKCLYKVGCKGPVSFAPCGERKWNGHVSWCVQNAPCQGCSEPDFWDKLTPFYEQVREGDLAGIGGLTAEKIGIGLGVATAVGLGAHLIGQVATGRLGHGGPPEGPEGPRGGER